MSELANFSKLSPPDLIDTLQYSKILDEIKADFNTRIDSIDISQLNINEPIIKILEVFALREINIRARINECAKQVLVSSATGSNLDHLGALVGVYRSIINRYDQNESSTEEPEYENDESFRLRIPLAFERISNAGTKGAYKFYALNTPGVLDVSVFQNPSMKETLTNEVGKIPQELPNLDLLEAASDGIVNICVLPVNNKRLLRQLSKEAKDEAQKKAACETETLKEMASEIHKQRKMACLEKQKDINILNKKRRKNEIAVEKEKNQLNNSNKNIEKITKELDEKKDIFAARKTECEKVDKNKTKNDKDKLEYRELLEASTELSYSLENLEISEESYKRAQNRYLSVTHEYYINSVEKRAKERDICDSILPNLIQTASNLITEIENLKNAKTEYILPRDMKDKNLLNRKIYSSEVQNYLKAPKEIYLEHFYDKSSISIFKRDNDELKEKYKTEIKNKKIIIDNYDQLVSTKEMKKNDYYKAQKRSENAKNDLEQLREPLLKQEQNVEKARADRDASRNNFNDEENILIECVYNRKKTANEDFLKKQKDLTKAEEQSRAFLKDITDAENNLKITCDDLLIQEEKLLQNKKEEITSSVKASNCILKDDLSNSVLYKIIKEESDEQVKLNKEIIDLRNSFKKYETAKDNAKIEFFAASNKLNQAINNYKKVEENLDKKTIKKNESRIYIDEIKQLSINTIKANYEEEHDKEYEVNYYDILTNKKQIKKYPQIVKEKEKAFFLDHLVKPIEKQLNSDEIKPVTDLLNVTLANIVHYNISGKVYLNSLFDSDVLKEKVAEINKSLQDYISSIYKLNQGVTKIGIYSVINNEVVDNIELDEFKVDEKYVDPKHNNDLIPLKHTAYLCNEDEIKLSFLVENYNVGKKELIKAEEK